VNQRPTGRRSGAGRRSGNPAVRAGTVPPTPARASLERRSHRPLARLAALPRWSVVVGILVLVVAALIVPGLVGALLLLVVGALLAWLLALAWPVLGIAGRANRILLLVLVVAYASWKLLA
jgi:hypothetical protein